MKLTMNVHDFRDAFVRSDRANSFSYEGLGALFDYLEEVDSDMEFDLVGIDSEFTEGTISFFKEQYSNQYGSFKELESNHNIVLYVDDLVNPRDVDDEANEDCLVIISD